MKQIIFLFAVLCWLPVFAEDHLPVSSEKDGYMNRKKFDYFFLEALRLRESEKHGDTFATLLYALKIDSTSSVALSQLSDYYLFLQQDSLAIDALEKAVRYNPDNFEYKTSLAGIYRDMGNNIEAIRLYEELLTEYPSKSELNFFLSDLYLKENRIDKSIDALDALENNIGMNEALSLQKHKLYLSVNQKENALKEIEKLTAKYPSEAKYQIIIGDFYLDQNELEKALIYYEKAHTIDPQNPYYVVSMANYYEKKENTEAAAAEIEKALKNQLLDVETKLSILGRYIGNLMHSKKDMNSANALFETLMEQHSQEKELNLMYGQFLVAQDKLDEAKFQFQVVTEATPEDIRAWKQLLNLAIRSENIDEINEICDAALVHFPDASEFYFYKGSALYQKKQYEDALAIFMEGSKHIPEEEIGLLSTFYGQIGDLFHQMNEKEKAYTFYDKSLEYNENNVFVLNNYAYFLSLDKSDLDKAERMSGKCVKAQPNNPTYIDTYAWVLFQRENYSLAKFYIESAIMNGGEKSPDVIEHYGDILSKNGNIDMAIQQWEKALKLKLENENEDTTILKKKIEDKTYYENDEN
jgi:tetratricopeptide (TPR) repeat protein